MTHLRDLLKRWLLISPSRWSAVWLGLTVLVLGLGVTRYLWHSELDAAQAAARQDFEGKTDLAVVRLGQRFDLYQQMLRATEGLFVASAEVQSAEFKRFAASTIAPAKMPEISTLGFIAAGRGSAVATLVEPDSPLNNAMRGRDIYPDVLRREALEFAARTGGLALSNKILLLDEQEAEAQTGLRLYWPVYADAQTGQRRVLRGWVFAAIDLREMMQDFNRASSQLDIRLYDGDDTLDDLAEHAADRVGGAADMTMLTAARRVEIGGYTWTVVAHSLPQYGAKTQNDRAPLILRFGVAASFLLALFIALLQHAALRGMRQQLALARQRQALQLNESLLQAVLENAPVGIWLMDATGHYRFINQAFCTMTGISEENFLRAGNLTELMDAASAEQCIASDRACLAGSGTYHSLETLRLADGKLHQLAVTKVKLHDGQGQVLGLIGVAQDVSEQHEKEEALQALVRAKTAFMTNMSHEIRTPMNSVLGMTWLALDENPQGKLRDYLEKIGESGQLLLAIIDDILDYSKIEAGKLEIELIDFDLDALLTSVLNLHSERARAKGLGLRIESALGPLRLRGDALRIRQVLVNLVDNALKFTARGEVLLRVLRDEHGDGSTLRFEVQDSGMGMSPGVLTRLFQPFEQADMSITRQFGGSGLGLSICKRLVELMGGQIGVSSKPGHGSVFWFSLDLAHVLPPSSAAEESKLTEELLHTLQDAKILLAENNPFNQEIAVEFLLKGGMSTRIANNGFEALAWLRRERFDCVLMDVQMPEMDGLEAARQIRSDPKLADIPIIAMTANVFREDREQCLAAGMDDFLGKPMHPQQLYIAIARQLAARASQDFMAQTEERLPDQLDDLELTDLHQRIGGDRARLEEFVRRFVRLSRDDLARLESDIAAQVRGSVYRWGHHMRSPAHMAGAYQFAALCAKLEAVHEGEWEQARQLAAELAQALNRVEAALPGALARLP